jgi:hypothetical protein
MKVIYTSIFMIILVLLSGLPLISGPGATNYANAARYATDTQIQANTNECEGGTNCAINSPQTQGDGSASSPTNLQTSETNEEASTPPTTSEPVHLFIETGIICVGIGCPNEEDFRYHVMPLDPSTSVDPQTFDGHELIFFSKGGRFDMTVTLPPNPQGQTPSFLRHCDVEVNLFLVGSHDNQLELQGSIRPTLPGLVSICEIIYAYS